MQELTLPGSEQTTSLLVVMIFYPFDQTAAIKVKNNVSRFIDIDVENLKKAIEGLNEEQILLVTNNDPDKLEKFDLV